MALPILYICAPTQAPILRLSGHLSLINHTILCPSRILVQVQVQFRACMSMAMARRICRIRMCLLGPSLGLQLHQLQSLHNQATYLPLNRSSVKETPDPQGLRGHRPFRTLSRGLCDRPTITKWAVEVAFLVELYPVLGLAVLVLEVISQDLQAHLHCILTLSIRQKRCRTGARILRCNLESRLYARKQRPLRRLQSHDFTAISPFLILETSGLDCYMFSIVN